MEQRTLKIYDWCEGVAGLRPGDDAPNPASPHLSPNQASLPGDKKLFAPCDRSVLYNESSYSQPDIKINSSIAINVTDLKHKIVGLEQQLSDVNRHCLDLAGLENNSKRNSQTFVSTEDNNEINSINDQSEVSAIRKSNGVETKLLYKTSESHYRKSDDSVEKGFSNDHGKYVTAPVMDEDYIEGKKLKKLKRKPKDRIKASDAINSNLYRHKTQSASENFVSSYSSNSYYSLINPRTSHRVKTEYPDYHCDKNYKHRQYMDLRAETPIKLRKPKDHIKIEKSTENLEMKHKSKAKARAIDEKFISEIIDRQYRPIKMFGRKQSGISQFSAPVCRDQEYTVRENIMQGSDLCSCCYDRRKKCRYEYEHNLSDMHSICDTRLYSSKREMRHRHRRKYDCRCHDFYNNVELYDLIPVKEKASPKPRRKVPEEENISYNYYREVPPSPRTLRPRLNLKAQYYNEFEEYMQHKINLAKNSSPAKFSRQNKHERPYDNNNELSSRLLYPEFNKKQELQTCKNIQQDSQIQHDSGTMNSFRSKLFNNGQENITDTALNKTQDTDISTDKTDKALSEIKEILQNFLQEIKKETATTQCSNSDITNKNGDKCSNDFRNSVKLNTSIIPNSGLNNFGVPPPYMPFTNPCCYPVFPVCPTNCIQNGYILPSSSYTCASCANNAKDSNSKHHTNIPKETANTAKASNETEELIKEIYKFVAQNPNSIRKEQGGEKNDTSPRDKIINNKGLIPGGSSNLSKHDAKVGTHKIKCYSKSCDAIGSRMTTDTHYSSTNPTYSDTVLERLSLEVTATSSESDVSTVSMPVEKKQNKFVRALRSFGIAKKKKDVIEELSESESTVEVEIKPKKPIYKQDVMNYVMHGQEYYNRPPIPPNHQCHTYQPNYHSGCVQAAGYENHCCHKPLEHGAHSMRPHSPAPPCPGPYDHHHQNEPQVPLCLKEIEVKSIATQSDRKMNFFRMLTKKIQGPAVEYRQDGSGPRNCSTQTAGQVLLNKPNKFGKFNWKALQAKVNELDKPENLNFSYKTQKRLAEGDMKIRNAMFKKLFHKRNPFSPRNLIVRTILGKDKSSFGQPPVIYRPRMFL